MTYQEIKINEKTIFIPDYYQKVDSMPEDPKDSIPFMVQTSNALCFALIFSVDYSESLPRTKESLIEGIRKFIGDKQGLIQVEAFEDHVYSIVKTLKEPSGVQYVLNFQKFYPDSIVNIQAFFEEVGMTGIRDTTVYEICRRENLVGFNDDIFSGWAKDPYDETITTGALMNLSEQEKFDKLFPGFPLSMCRELVKALEYSGR